MCGSLMIMHVLAPSLTPQRRILIRIVSCGMVGDGQDGKLSYSNDACNGDLHVNVCSSPIFVGA